jgi:membrane protein
VSSRLFDQRYHRLSRLEGVLRAVIVRATQKEIPFLAASIAYYAFAALIPLLLFAFIAISAVGGTELALRIITVTQGVLTPTSQEFVRDAITQTEGRLGVVVGASLVFVWSVFRLLRGLDIAISMVYETDISPPLLTQLTTAGMLFLALLIAGTGLIGVSVLFAVLPDLPLIGLASGGAVLFALVLVFWPIYYLLPGVEHSPIDALPGAIVAACSWTLLNTLFGAYPAYATQYEVYGVLGGVLLLLAWFYISGVIIVFGAVINAVLY